MCRRSFLGALAAFLGLVPRAVAAGAVYHPGHSCPQCGKVVVVVAAYGPGPGQHYHRHGRTWWYH